MTTQYKCNPCDFITEDKDEYQYHLKTLGHLMYTDEDNERKKRKMKRAILKLQVWDTYIGPDVFSTHCSICFTNEIGLIHFKCGYVKPKRSGGKRTVENLRPICEMCYRAMGNSGIEHFKEWFWVRKEYEMRTGIEVDYF